MNILLVDDDKDSRSSVGEFLRELGHHVVECDDGYDALKVFHIKEFQMVLSDIKMPRMSGLELLREISALPHGKTVDFILFTGYGDMNSAIEALRAGAYDYLLKPVNIKELAALIESIEKKQELRRKKREIIKVLIVSNQWAVKEGYKSLLQNEKGYIFVGEAPETEECLLEIEKTEPHVVIINSRLENKDKFKLCAMIKNRFPNVGIIIPTCCISSELKAEGIKEGVSAFFLEEANPSEVLYIIKKVSEEGKFIDSAITETLLNDELNGVKDGKCQLEGLTEQENKVLDGLAQGKTNKEMAEELYLSPATIRNYVSNILRKLDLPNRAAATAYAIKKMKEK